jgi:hypothetical protein
MCALPVTSLRGTFRGPTTSRCPSWANTAQRSVLLPNRWCWYVSRHDVHVLDGGLQAWRAAEQPIALDDAGAMAWTLERQVRLVAGGLVAASIAISVVWPPGRYLAGAVGIGLAGAALTDSCMLGNLLARMPYNRRSAAAGCDMPTVVAELTERSGTPS